MAKTIGAREKLAQQAAERQRQRARTKLVKRGPVFDHPPPPPPPAFFDDKEVETITGLDQLTVAKLLMDGVLQRTKVGRRHMVTGDSVRQLMGFGSKPMDTATAAEVRSIAFTPAEQLRAKIRYETFLRFQRDIEQLRDVLAALPDELRESFNKLLSANPASHGVLGSVDRLLRERIADVRKDLRRVVRIADHDLMYGEHRMSDAEIRRHAIYDIRIDRVRAAKEAQS